MALANSATSPHPGQSLLNLPTELVVQVIEHLADAKKELCSLAQTCRLLQDECEKHIYSTIELLSTNDLRDIIDAFSRRPERIASVETLKILYQFHDGLGATSAERMEFNKCVAGMKALKYWHIESPFDNFNWNKGGNEWVERDMEAFRVALEAASFQHDHGQLTLQADLGLSRLEKMVVHSHGATSDFWDLDGFHCLFRHPSLRYLHASCFVLPKDLAELDSYAKTTPLTTLVFDECELEPSSLRSVLRTPKSLKHLTLGENVYNVRKKGISPKLSRAPEASLEALKEVAHSLETLTHYDPYWRMLFDSYKPRLMRGAGLRDFHRLRFMDVDPCSFLHHLLLCHTQAPPNLETLRIRHARVKFYGLQNIMPPDLFEELPDFNPYTYLASLKTLEFVQGASSDTWMAKAGHICQPDMVRERHAYAYKLHKHGIQMKMYLEATRNMGLMPPYLHREPAPELLCVYDSVQVGFRRDIVDELDDTSATRTRVQLILEDLGIPVSEHVEDELMSDIPALSGLLHHRESPVSVRQTHAAPKAYDRECPETDQLNVSDILRLRNEADRSLKELWARMEASDGEPDPTEPTYHIYYVDSSGEDEEDDEEDDDDDDDDDDEDDDYDEGDDFEEAADEFFEAEVEAGLVAYLEAENGEDRENDLD